VVPSVSIHTCFVVVIVAQKTKRSNDRPQSFSTFPTERHQKSSNKNIPINVPSWQVERGRFRGKRLGSVTCVENKKQKLWRMWDERPLLTWVFPTAGTDDPRKVGQRLRDCPSKEIHGGEKTEKVCGGDWSLEPHEKSYPHDHGNRMNCTRLYVIVWPDVLVPSRADRGHPRGFFPSVDFEKKACFRNPIFFLSMKIDRLL